MFVFHLAQRQFEAAHVNCHEESSKCELEHAMFERAVFVFNAAHGRLDAEIVDLLREHEQLEGALTKFEVAHAEFKVVHAEFKVADASFDGPDALVVLNERA